MAHLIPSVTNWLRGSPRLAALAALTAVLSMAQAQETITVASTTSTEQSGLFSYLLPLFEQHSGITVRVVALGTGQALDIARRGDADVVLVHDRAAEDKFVAEGYGINRRDVMYNDFVIIGPKSDPSGVKKAADVLDVFRRVAAGRTPFVSRGDRSGTHAAELRLWKDAGIDPKSFSGYREAGAGMGPTLNTSAGLGAYTLSDRGTWLSFKNRQDLEIVFAGDKRLFNPYGVILVNPERHPHVKKEAGQRFIEWLVAPAGQAAIAAYR
ncbi:MAG TPA: substrate-binding domain-containing protein, partial [Burkholderiaceae bacterium]|nr:substrate-binding domain-containing protein [Burkholderiaceae bacterium]